MPTYLRFDAIRLLEASVESLDLAVRSLGAAKRTAFRQAAAQYAVECGLLGVSAELAMSACLVQALGSSALTWPSGVYKAGSQVLDDFQGLVRESTVKTEFLTQGVEYPAAHRQSLLACLPQFRRLIAIRAGGLHAGRGLLHEAALLQASSVADFLAILSASSRISPYLPFIPRPLTPQPERVVILEDLRRRLTSDDGDAAALLSSLYLVLPDIPEEEPEWLGTLQRVSIAPRKRDVEFLMEVVEDAVPANLRRTTRAGSGIPVAVRPGDPDALPISPQYLRRQFNDIPDQWHADIANANGRLEGGYLDLPPAEAVRELFALGLESAGILEEGGTFTAHESWPAIAASLSVAGTPGPYWFLARRTPDLGQLRAVLGQAEQHASARLTGNLAEVYEGVDAIRSGRPLARDNPHFAPLLEDLREAESAREALTAAEQRNRSADRALPAEYSALLEDIATGGQPVGTLLLQILEGGHEQPVLTYWPRILAESATEADDIPALVATLAVPDSEAGHTAARKALRRIDYTLYGPAMEEPSGATDDGE